MTGQEGEQQDLMRTEHSLLEGMDTKESISYIEELIHRQYHKTEILRLMCLLSLTQNGLPAQTYKALKTQFLHVSVERLCFASLTALISSDS